MLFYYILKMQNLLPTINRCKNDHFQFFKVTDKGGALCGTFSSFGVWLLHSLYQWPIHYMIEFTKFIMHHL